MTDEDGLLIMSQWFDRATMAYKLAAKCNRCGMLRVYSVPSDELFAYSGTSPQYESELAFRLTPRCPCRDRELAHQVARKRCVIGAAVQRRRDARVRMIDRRRAAWSSDED